MQRFFVIGKIIVKERIVWGNIYLRIATLDNPEQNERRVSMSIGNNRVRNAFYMIILVLLLGAFAGGITWAFLRLVSIVTPLLWETLPSKLSFRWFPVILCGAGGLLIGIIHRLFGEYPESLDVVLGKVRKQKTYPYRSMGTILVCAFLPLVLGASVGPEAGLAGVITGLCYWVGDNIRFASEAKKTYTEVGMAVTLGVLFRVPLFGIFAVEEDSSERGSIVPEMKKTSKLLYYAIAAAAGLGVYSLLGQLAGKGMEGFPAFDAPDIKTVDYAAAILYCAVGILMYLIYEFSERIIRYLSDIVPPILRETIGGVVLGVMAIFMPMALFSGEEEMAVLMDSFSSYAPLFLILLAIVKLLLTSWCIRMGLRGGHFFPLIFACTSMGYGVSMLLFQDSGLHAAFACAVITASALGAQMKKPMAVVLLLLLCFPVRLIFWLFLAAVVGRKAAEILGREVRRARMRLMKDV